VGWFAVQTRLADERQAALTLMAASLLQPGALV
jgi:hypothetical protein